MIKINDYSITEKEFDFAIADYKNRAQQPELTRSEVQSIADQLIDAKLLLVRAKEEKITITDDEINKALENIKSNYETEDAFKTALEGSGDNLEKLKNRVFDSLALQKYIEEVFVSKVVVSDEDAEKYYAENKEKFVSEKKVHALHILFKPDNLDGAAKVKDLLANGADFGEMAKEYSECPSKESGGDLGFFGKGQMVPEFEQASFEATVDEVSAPVKTQFGYHLIKVTEKSEAGSLEFDEVKDNLKNQIKTSVVNHNIQKLAKELRTSAKIEIDSKIMNTKK